MAKRPSSIRLQTRDLELFRGLYESRVMTLRHMTILHFEDHAAAAKKRVQQLMSAGFLTQRRQTVNDHAIYSVSQKAFQLLLSEGMLDVYPKRPWRATRKRIRVSDLTLRHELDVMDIKAAFFKDIRTKPNLCISKFSTWPQRFEFKAYHQLKKLSNTVQPDAFVQIEDQNIDMAKTEHFLFLEVDRSTESQAILLNKAFSYRDYYTRSRLADSSNETKATHKSPAFRLLFVFKTTSRMDTAAETLRQCQPSIRTFAWLSTLALIKANPLGPIWTQLEKYQNIKSPSHQKFTKYQAGDKHKQLGTGEFISSKILRPLFGNPEDTQK